MRNKVVYISVFLMFSALSSGYAQKSILSLLPSSDTEMKLYYMEAENFETAKSSSDASYSNYVNKITPDITRSRRSSMKKEYRLCRIIGSVCKKEWSKGLIKIFRLPTTTGIRIY